MAETLTNRIKNAWNAFRSRDSSEDYKVDIGPSYVAYKLNKEAFI